MNTSNTPASAPVNVIVSLPRASSVYPMSATLTADVVLALSAKDVVVFPNVTPDGASLTVPTTNLPGSGVDNSNVPPLRELLRLPRSVNTPS